MMCPRNVHNKAIQILEYQMVRALCRFDLVQAMAPIWRQWFTSDSGLSLLTIPAVSALPSRALTAENRKRIPNQLYSETLLR